MSQLTALFSLHDRLVSHNEVELFMHQAGGHGGILSFRNAPGTLLKKTLLKPVMTGLKGQVEKSFYQATKDSVLERRFLAAFQGCVHVQAEDAKISVDLKMGRVTFDPLATPEKRRRESGKYALQSELGFRITGMRVYDHALGAYRVYDKAFGRGLGTADAVVEGLRAFFQTGLPGPLPSCLLPALLARLREIEEWFAAQHMYRFFASSLLVLYEAEPDPPTSASASVLSPPLPAATRATGPLCASRPSEQELLAPAGPRAVSRAAVFRCGSRVGVYMIDFGHVFPMHSDKHDWLDTAAADSRGQLAGLSPVTSEVKLQGQDSVQRHYPVEPPASTAGAAKTAELGSHRDPDCSRLGPDVDTGYLFGMRHLIAAFERVQQLEAKDSV